MYNMFYGGIGIIFLLFYIAIIVLSIYCTVLFIKLAHRGIKALDIYLNKNNNSQAFDNDMTKTNNFNDTQNPNNHQ